MNLPASLTVGLQPPPARPAGDDDALSDLVARAKGGDREAYTVLYRRHLNDVYRYALVRLRDREAAEDATQTIFVRALGALPTCRDNESFVGWLFAIARTVVADHFRAPHRDLTHLPDEDAWPDVGPSPEDLVIEGETTRFLLAARDRCLSGQERGTVRPLAHRDERQTDRGRARP